MESARLDQEEVELRNKIGEFEPSEFEKRKRQCRKVVKERQATIAASDEFRTKFLSAFPSEEDLLQHPANATVLISRADLDAMAASTQDTASSTVQAVETDAPAARDIDTRLNPDFPDQGLRTSTHTKGSRVMMAAGHRWGRGSLAEAAKLGHTRRILILTRASSVTRWGLSGKSPVQSLTANVPQFGG